jgi:hypothetical protein
MPFILEADMTSLNISKLSILLEGLNEKIQDYETFIETGALIGDTVIDLSSHFNKLHTIEISDHYYNITTDRIKNEGLINIKTHLGDSVKVLPKILNRLNTQTIFWLDGHWSAGDTGRGEKDCPLIDECSFIDQKYKPDRAIILIDDYRLFGTNLDQDWSKISIDSIENCFTINKVVNQFIHEDVLALVVTKK